MDHSSFIKTSLVFGSLEYYLNIEGLCEFVISELVTFCVKEREGWKDRGFNVLIVIYFSNLHSFMCKGPFGNLSNLVIDNLCTYRAQVDLEMLKRRKTMHKIFVIKILFGSFGWYNLHHSLHGTLMDHTRTHLKYILLTYTYMVDFVKFS